MNSRLWKTIALVMALLIALTMGAAIGGGIVYAAARMAGRAPQVSAAGAVDPESDPESGIVIVRTLPDGPAAEAGVVRGDILLAVDGEQVDDLHGLHRVLERREPGDEVELTVLHGDEERTLAATLADRDGKPFLGLTSCGGLFDMPPFGRRIHSGPGAVIIEVMSDSPAEEAGLQLGDRIIAVDGQEPGVENDLADLIADHAPGTTVTVELQQPGEESREVTIELGEHPEEEGRAYLGVRYVSLPHIDMLERHELPHFRMPHWHFDLNEKQFGVRPGRGIQQGVIIRQVAEDSPAEAAGLAEGDVVTAIDGEPVQNPRALVDAVGEHKPGDALTLAIIPSDGTEEREVEVTLAEDPEDEGTAYLGVVIGGFFMHRSGDGELPPRMELPDGSFRFRLPFMKEHLELDGLDDALRHFEFRLRPWDRDRQRSNSPGDSA